jgi:hypothetical protein
MLLTYFLNDFEMVPFAPIITGITFVFIFHMHCISIIIIIIILIIHKPNSPQIIVLFVHFRTSHYDHNILSIYVVSTQPPPQHEPPLTRTSQLV